MAETGFAKLDSNNIVLDVICIDTDSIMQDGEINEDLGIQKCVAITGHASWKMTDEGMWGNVNTGGGTLLRKNAAQIGGTYDEGRDAFIQMQVFPSWTLNESTCLWDPPFSLTSAQIDAVKHWWSEENLTYLGTTPGNADQSAADVKWNKETNAWENWTP